MQNREAWAVDQPASQCCVDARPDVQISRRTVPWSQKLGWMGGWVSCACEASCRRCCPAPSGAFPRGCATRTGRHECAWAIAAGPWVVSKHHPAATHVHIPQHIQSRSECLSLSPRHPQGLPAAVVCVEPRRVCARLAAGMYTGAGAAPAADLAWTLAQPRRRALHDIYLQHIRRCLVASTHNARHALSAVTSRVPTGIRGAHDRTVSGRCAYMACMADLYV